MDLRKLEIGQHLAKDPMKQVQAYLELKGSESTRKIRAVRVLNVCFPEAQWQGLWDGKNLQFRYRGSGEERWEFTTMRTQQGSQPELLSIPTQ